MPYVVHRRLRAQGISGYLNLPYGTICELKNGILEKDGRRLVMVTSENAHQYFARNDDGRGFERGKLTQEIQAQLLPPPLPKSGRSSRAELDKRDAEVKRQIAAWERIWNDPKLQQFKMAEHADHWLWNHAFFNADIEDLNYILSIIKGGVSCTN